MKSSPCTFAPEDLVSRDEFGSSVPRQPAYLRTKVESGAYVRDFSRIPRRRPFIYINRHITPSGQSRVYRVTQLRTDGIHCRESAGTHGVSKPQGSSERVLPWQVTMDQSLYASLSHTHYWYEVDMLKVLDTCTRLLTSCILWHQTFVLYPHPADAWMLISSALIHRSHRRPRCNGQSTQDTFVGRELADSQKCTGDMGSKYAEMRKTPSCGVFAQTILCCLEILRIMVRYVCFFCRSTHQYCTVQQSDVLPCACKVQTQRASVCFTGRLYDVCFFRGVGALIDKKTPTKIL